MGVSGLGSLPGLLCECHRPGGEETAAVQGQAREWAQHGEDAPYWGAETYGPAENLLTCSSGGGTSRVLETSGLPLLL